MPPLRNDRENWITQGVGKGVLKWANRSTGTTVYSVCLSLCNQAQHEDYVFGNSMDGRNSYRRQGIVNVPYF